MSEELPNYTGENCEKCGRNRVEPYENGDEICEKCSWNKTKQRYEEELI